MKNEDKENGANSVDDISVERKKNRSNPPNPNISVRGEVIKDD